jgi:predicted NACHT family NTPase
VGWANVLSTVLTALGLIMSIGDKLGALSIKDNENLASMADGLTRQALRQDSALLAQLLGTDSLDNRPSRGTFQVGALHGRMRAKGKRSKPVIKEFGNIVDFYLKETKRRLLILGRPGSGKTALAVLLTVGLLQRRVVDQPSDPKTIKIACLLSLPSWDPASDTLIEWVAGQIADRFRIARKIAVRLLKDGWILPVLDGLDEMDLQNESVPRRTVAPYQGLMITSPALQIVR